MKISDVLFFYNKLFLKIFVQTCINRDISLRKVVKKTNISYNMHKGEKNENF